MKNNRILRNLIWVVLLVFFLEFSSRYLQTAMRRGASEFDYSGVLVATTLLPILFGILLRMPALVSRWDRGMRFDTAKFFIQGLPALFFAGFMLFYFLPATAGFRVPTFFSSLTSNSRYGIYLGGVWFGTVITDSIKGKKIPKSSTEKSGQ